MKKINSGEFRHPIKIQRISNDKIDSDGILQLEWNDLFSIKAKVTNVKFEEVVIAQGEGITDIKKFYIRFRKGIKRTDRIIFNDEIYEIKAVDDIENKGFYLSIKGVLIQ